VILLSGPHRGTFAIRMRPRLCFMASGLHAQPSQRIWRSTPSNSHYKQLFEVQDRSEVRTGTGLVIVYYSPLSIYYIGQEEYFTTWPSEKKCCEFYNLNLT